MSDSFAEMFADEEKKELKKLTPGQKITATVVGISGESIFLDVGAKSEGVLNASEITDEDGNMTIAEGDSLEVFYIRTKGAELMLTTKVGSGSSAEHFEEAYRSSIPVEGTVQEEIKGGFSISLGGKTRGFCPYSQMGLRRVDNASEEYLEKTMNFLITRFEQGGRNLVLSARAILEQEREKKRDELKEILQEGQLVKGEVTSIRDFGAFIDIGGIEGLIPVSEIGWSRVEKIEEYLHVGQKVEAIIKKLDWDNNRLSFSLKEALENPWEKAQQELLPGTLITGKIIRLAPFGAFVSLREGVDGLIHISKLGKGRKIHHPREAVEEGQDIEVTVENFDLEEKRISLAPADYVSEESEEKVQKAEFTKFKANKAKQQKETGGMGTFGDLLEAQLKKKKTQ